MKLFSEYKGLRKEVYILCFGRTMTNLGSIIWPMFTLILNRKLGLNASDIALCMMLYSIAAIPVSLFGGKLADRYSKKNVIIAADCISILAYFYCAAVPVTKLSVLVFSVASLFQTIEWPSYEALIADITSSADRERAFSLHYLGANLGSVLAPTLGGLLINSHLNLAFLISGISIASSTFLIALLIRDVHREEDDSAAGRYQADIDSNASPVRYVLGNRVILLFFISSILAYAVYDMFGYLMPLDLTAVHGEPGSVIYGTMTSVNCVLVVLLTAGITRWLRRLSDGKKILLGQTLIGFGLLIFVLFVKNTLICYLAISVFTVGEIIDTIAASPFLTRRIPASHRGRISAVLNVVSTCFVGAFQLGIGRLYDRFGSAAAWKAVFLVTVLMLAVLCVLQKLDRTDYPALAKGAAEQEDGPLSGPDKEEGK